MNDVLENVGVLVQILTFSEALDLYRFGLTCRRHARLVFDVSDREFEGECSYLWKELFMNDVFKYDYTKPNLVVQPIQQSSNWKLEYRQAKSIQFDVEGGSKTLKDPAEILFSNRYHTVEKFNYNSGNYWETIRATKELRAPGIYSWKFVLDNYELCNGNSYCIILGVESDKYPWVEQGKVVSIIGNFTASEGVGIIIGNQHFNYKEKVTPFEQSLPNNEPFARGDEIGVVFDMSREGDRAQTKKNKIKFYRNNKKIKVGMRDGPVGDLFYPAVSLIGAMKVSVYYWSPPAKEHAAE